MNLSAYLVDEALPGGLAALQLPLLGHDAVVALEALDLLALAGLLL